MAALTLETRWDHPAVAPGQPRVLHLMITLKGAAAAARPRPPLSLAIAVDCSGSMGEERGRKLSGAKTSLAKLVEHLADADTLAMAGFSDHVFEILPATPMTAAGRATAVSAVSKLRPLSATNLSGATEEAYRILRRATGQIARAFLFTDGLPTAGLTDKESLVRLAAARPPGVGLTTFGYGANHDPDLLARMSHRGGGNFYYVRRPDEVPEFFGRELGGLLSCVAQGVKIRFEGAPGVTVLKALNDPEAEIDETQTRVTVAAHDLYADEKRKFLIRVKVPAPAGPGAIPVGTVDVEFADLLSGAAGRACAPAEVACFPAESIPADPDPAVAEQIVTIRAAEAQDAARRYADQKRFADAQRAIVQAADACRAVGTDFARKVADDLLRNVLKCFQPEEYAAGGSIYAASNATAYRTNRSVTMHTKELFATESMILYAGSMSGSDAPTGPTAAKPPPRRKEEEDSE